MKNNKPSTSKNSSCVIGEYYTICELYRNNLTPLVPPNPMNKSWDLIVLASNKKPPVKLQIKTITWPRNKTKPTIRGKFSCDYDILIVVIVNYDDKTPYLLYIIPKRNIIEANRGGLPHSSEEPNLKFNQKPKTNKNTIPFSTLKNRVKEIMDKNYKNKWKFIEDLLQ